MKVSMKVSTQGEQFIAKEEGFRSKPYLCTSGVPTIGYGSTYYADGTHVKLADKAITKDQALVLFKLVLAKYVDGVNRYLQVLTTQNQFDALVSLAYNIGLENFRTSSVLKYLNKGSPSTAGKHILDWKYSNGKPVLLPRRLREQALFNKP